MLIATSAAVAHADEPTAAPSSAELAPAGPAPDLLEPELPTELRAPFTLVVNQVDHGEILVGLQEGRVLVPRAALIAAGIRVPEGRTVEAFGETLLDLSSVSPPLRYELEESTITLRIIAPVELLPTTTIDLADRPEDIVYSQRPSAFFNYAPRLTDFDRLELYEEMGVSVDGKLLFSSAYLSNEHAPIRGLTQLTIDDRASLRRTTVGDALALTGPLGSGAFIGGATVSRSYELDPYVVRTPQLGHLGSTTVPATLDVYVNGARVRSEPLQPGTFRLDNLLVGGGAGNVTYVVRDAFGYEQTVNAPYYIASGALAKGRDEYTYSMGLVRHGIGVESFGYDEGAALARHRLGVSNHVTVGGRAEATRHVLSLGPSITVLTPIGQVELELGKSLAAQGGSGLAGFLSYGYTSRLFSAGAFGRVMSDRYATLDLRATEDRNTVEVGALQATPIGTYLTVSLQGAFAVSRDYGDSARLGAQLMTRIDSMWQLFLTGSQHFVSGRDSDWSAMLTLSAALPHGHNASVAGRMETGEPSLLLNANHSLPVGEGFGYRASGVIAEHSYGEALAQYQTLFGRYGAQYENTSGEHHVALDAAGAIVVVPGVGVFPTLPVQDGYAVIRLPGVANVRGYVNNHEIGRTDRNGNLLVPGMLAYYGNRLRIAEQDVPIQYGFESTELTLAPPYRGVAVAEFGVSIPHYYRGRVVVVDADAGQRVIPKYGEIHVKVGNEELVSPLSELGELELEGLDAGTRTFTVEYFDGRCEGELDVPMSDEVVIDLGEPNARRPSQCPGAATCELSRSGRRVA